MTNALALRALQSEHVILHHMGIEFDPIISYEEWEKIGQTLNRLDGWVKFAIGDWLRFGEHKWGQMYNQATEETQLSESTLQDYVWVAEAVNRSVRTEHLSWSHHKLIAREYFKERPWLQKQELEEAATFKFTVREFESDLKERYPEAFNGSKHIELERCPWCGQIIRAD